MAIDVVTHNGIFHADEVVAIAIIRMLREDLNIIRTRDPEIIKHATVAIDVGGVYDVRMVRYDHHQKDFNEYYEDGTKYASAGLIWLNHGHELLQKYVPYHFTVTGDHHPYQEYDGLYQELQQIIKTIDAVDNGQMDKVGVTKQVTLSQIISTFNPIATDATPEERDAAFHKAVEFAMWWLDATVRQFADKYKNAQLLDQLFTSGNRVVDMDTFIPWAGSYMDKQSQYPDVKLVVYPGSDGTWRVQSVPMSKENPQGIMCPAPESIRGLRYAELCKVTGLSNLIFVHVAGFIGGTTTKEAAMELANWWLNNQ